MSADDALPAPLFGRRPRLECDLRMTADSRLRWQCRRGMRELDELLLGYLERCYPGAGEPEKEAFRRLLALPDSRLIDYLLDGNAVDEPELSDIVRRVRSRAGSGEAPAPPAPR